MGGIYQEKFDAWTNKEMQLSRLHEELLIQRESLLSFTLTYTRSRGDHSIMDIAKREQSRIRNEEFLENLEQTQVQLAEEASSPPSPRMTALQANYWYMVKSMKPMWEQTIKHKKPVSNRKDSRLGKPSMTTSKKTASLHTSQLEETKQPDTSAIKGKGDKKQKKKSKWTARFFN